MRKYFIGTGEGNLPEGDVKIIDDRDDNLIEEAVKGTQPGKIYIATDRKSTRLNSSH